MALASETDPRRAVVNMLDDEATDSDYDSGSKPSIIEVVEASTRKEKRTDRSDALYVWNPSDTPIEKFGAAGDERLETPVIQVDIQTHESDAHAYALREDVISIVGAYRNDSQQSTKFVDVYPITGTDARHHHNSLEGDGYIETVQIGFERKDSI